MTLMNQNKIRMTLLVMVLGFFAIPHAHAAEPTQWSVGAKLHATNWTVQDQSTGVETDADDMRLGLAVKFQNGRFYGGLSLLGGDFEFTGNAPARPTGPASTLPTTIKHGDTDLVFGYYFWPKVSLFLDLKNVSNEWDDGYKVEYGGIGYGISVVQPISQRWTFSGSFGLVPMRIELNGSNIGDAGRSALELSMHYTINQQFNMSFGLKSQAQTDEFDNGLKQEHHLGALVFGANLMF